MKKAEILILFLFLVFELSAQKEANIWYFGNRAGIDFNYNPPKALLNSKMVSKEGCSSVSDSNGNLLFYTNGVNVWNKNHDIMENGSGLFGSTNSVQSALVVKQPGNNCYYVFTTDSINATPYKDLPNRGLFYSIVDMSKQNGIGSVSLKNKFLFRSTDEKISAVEHIDRKSIWVAVTKNKSDSIILIIF